MLGGRVHTIMENAEALVVASKEIGLEVNAGKTMCMVTYRDQIAGQSHNIKINNSSFARVEEFKYFGATLTFILRSFNSVSAFTVLSFPLNHCVCVTITAYIL